MPEEALLKRTNLDLLSTSWAWLEVWWSTERQFPFPPIFPPKSKPRIGATRELLLFTFASCGANQSEAWILGSFWGQWNCCHLLHTKPPITSNFFSLVLFSKASSLKPELGIMFSLPLWGASRQVPLPAFDVYFLHSSIGTAISIFPEKRRAESEWAQISCKSDIIQSRWRPLHILLVMIGLSSNIRTYLRSMSCPPRSTSQNLTLREP